MVHIWKIFHLEYILYVMKMCQQMFCSPVIAFLDIFIIVSRFSDLGEYFNSHFNKFYPFSFVF